MSTFGKWTPFKGLCTLLAGSNLSSNGRVQFCKRPFTTYLGCSAQNSYCAIFIQTGSVQMVLELKKKIFALNGTMNSWRVLPLSMWNIIVHIPFSELIGPIFLQAILIPLQAQKIWAKKRIIFDVFIASYVVTDNNKLTERDVDNDIPHWEG